MNLIINLPHSTTDSLKLRTCIITDLIFCRNTSADFRGQNRYRNKLFKVSVQYILHIICIVMAPVILHMSCCLQNLTYAKQLPTSKCSSDFQTHHRFTYRTTASKRWTSFLYDPCKCCGRFFLHSLNFRDFRLWF